MRYKQKTGDPRQDRPFPLRGIHLQPLAGNLT